MDVHVDQVMAAGQTQRPKTWQSAMWEIQVTGCQLPMVIGPRPEEPADGQSVHHVGLLEDVIVVVADR